GATMRAYEHAVALEDREVAPNRSRCNTQGLAQFGRSYCSPKRKYFPDTKLALLSQHTISGIVLGAGWGSVRVSRWRLCQIVERKASGFDHNQSGSIILDHPLATGFLSGKRWIFARLFVGPDSSLQSSIQAREQIVAQGEGVMRKYLSWCAVLIFCQITFAADTITLKDGTSHSGSVVSVTARTVTFKEAGTVHRYPRSQVESLQFGGTSSAAAKTTTSEAAEASTLGQNSRKTVTLPAGTEIAVLTNQSIDSTTANEGQTFPADVAENVMNSSGQVVIPKGSEAELVVRKVAAGGVTSSPEVALDLQSIKVGGRRY